MSRLASILTAIAGHRAAYEAFQVAPDNEAESTCCEMADALDALVLTACSFPVVTQPLSAGAADLLAHLRWWLAEEAVHADDYQPNYSILQGRAADLHAILSCSASDEADAVLAAFARAEQAEGNLLALAVMYGAACKDLNVHRYLLEGVLEEAGELR